MFGVAQLFFKRDKSTINLIVAKVTDDFLLSGKEEDIREFMTKLRSGFDIGKVSVRGEFNFNGCEIRVGDKVTELSMKSYI